MTGPDKTPWNGASFVLEADPVSPPALGFYCWGGPIQGKLTEQCHSWHKLASPQVWCCTPSPLGPGKLPWFTPSKGSRSPSLKSGHLKSKMIWGKHEGWRPAHCKRRSGSKPSEEPKHTKLHGTQPDASQGPEWIRLMPLLSHSPSYLKTHGSQAKSPVTWCVGFTQVSSQALPQPLFRSSFSKRKGIKYIGWKNKNKIK